MAISYAGYWVNNAPVSSASPGFLLSSISCTAGQKPGSAAATIPDDQSGTHIAQAGMRLLCVNGTPTYQAKVSIDGTVALPALSVAAGDHITESVTR